MIIAMAILASILILVLVPPSITININKTMKVIEPIPDPQHSLTQEDYDNTIKNMPKEDIPPQLDDLLEAFNQTIHDLGGNK